MAKSLGLTRIRTSSPRRSPASHCCPLPHHHCHPQRWVSTSPVAPLQMLGGNCDCVELSGEDGDDDDDDDEFEDSEPIETTATETG